MTVMTGQVSVVCISVDVVANAGMKLKNFEAGPNNGEGCHSLMAEKTQSQWGTQIRGRFEGLGNGGGAALAPVSPSMGPLELSGLGLPLFQAEVGWAAGMNRSVIFGFGACDRGAGEG